MLVVETIAKIRRAYFQDKKSIKQICRELRVSRNTVRKVIRSGATELTYERTIQPLPKIGPWKDLLDEMLAVNARKPKRERLTRIRIFEELRARGYDGGYDAVRRYAASWSKEEEVASAAAYVPLSFDPGEAYQFDWSHEIVVIDGATTTVKVAHVRLCHSRMLFVRAYPRETQEMVFDAHDKAFAFFGGACARGIYDSGNCPPLVRGQWTRRPRSTRSSSAETAPTTAGSSRCAGITSSIRRPLGSNQWRLNERPCTPASGWEKGQVENQVGVVRRRFFVPRPKFRNYAELNAWLEDRCVAWAKANPHQELRDRTIWDVFQDERASLVPYVGPFDGFHAVPASVSKTCLVRFDKNRYSVDGRAVGRPVEIRAYAERVEFWQDGKIVGQHAVVHWARTNGASMDDLRARQGHLRPVALHSGSGSQARCPPEWRALQGLGPAAGDQARAAQAWQGAERRPADGPDPQHDPERWTGCGGCCLCRSPERRGPRSLGRHQYPGPASGAAAAADHRYSGRVATDLRARRRLQTLRQPQEARPWKDHRCWTR